MYEHVAAVKRYILEVDGKFGVLPDMTCNELLNSM